ncbi:MAG: response regulator [Pyrinomonadaceae bacterium]
MDNLTVLLVDDDDDCRLPLRLILERRGVRVVEASGGAEAVEVARRERPPLIFIDLLMPDLNGREVARRIRESGGVCDDAVLVAYSALANSDVKSEMLEGGLFNRYIDKVCILDELDDLLRPFRPTP